MIDITLLHELNTFRDFTFHPEEHFYMYKNEKCISTTQLLKLYKQPYNVDRSIKSKSVYSGKCENQVKAEFKFSSDAAQFKGNTLHSYAEHYINNKITTIDIELKDWLFGNEDPVTETLETLFLQFQQFCQNTKEYLIPVKSEYVIGDPEFCIGGMIDQLFFDIRDNLFHIYDWKTNKAINAQHSQYYFTPLSSMPASDLNTYSMQLSMYRLILERNTRLPFGESQVVWFNDSHPTYREITCFDYRSEALSLLNHYKNPKP